MKINLFLISILLIIAQLSKADTQYDFVKDFGGNGNGRFCNYLAFQKMANVISNTSHVTVNFPKGNYYIEKYIIMPCKSNENIFCVTETLGNGITNIFIKNTKFLTINGNGSLILVNGNFIRKKGFSLKNNFNYGIVTTVTPFFISNCSNLIIKNLIINGGLDDMQKEQNLVEGFSSGIQISDIEKASNNSSNILISNVNVSKFNNDGIGIFSNGSNIKIENSTFSYNARLGISVTSGNNIHIYNCKLINTGQHKYGNHSPSAGIDIEYEGIGKISGVVVEKCLIANNKGFQIVATGASNIRINDCIILDDTNGYSTPLNGIGIYTDSTYLINNIIYGSLQIDLGSIKIEKNRVFNIENNIIYSGFQGGASGILSDDLNSSCKVINNWLIMLPIKDSSKDVLFPLIRNSNLMFENNKVFIHTSAIPSNSQRFTCHPQLLKSIKNNMWLIINSKGEKEFKIAYTGSGETTKFANEAKESKKSIIIYKLNNKQVEIKKTKEYKSIFFKDIFSAKNLIVSNDKFKKHKVLSMKKIH
jgi:hypothetical protein